ncbi:MAG: monovalent cation/H(+) antiporter subunit G [Bacillota bacterium]
MINQWIAYLFIFCGLAFDFFGVLGLVRLPDVYNRLQASTKCVTFGSAGILFGVFIYFGFCPIGYKALLCIGFILLTSPVAAHAIARAAHRNGIPPAKGTVIDQYAEDKELKEEQS